jgi:hypothetical protein
MIMATLFGIAFLLIICVVFPALIAGQNRK